MLTIHLFGSHSSPWMGRIQVTRRKRALIYYLALTNKPFHASSTALFWPDLPRPSACKPCAPRCIACGSCWARAGGADRSSGAAPETWVDVPVQALRGGDPDEANLLVQALALSWRILTD
jgi:hypothetical protein